METEEKLAIDWLHLRQFFDSQARDPGLLRNALALLGNAKQPSIADLGAGSGNNALSLLPWLAPGTVLILVEQHDYLLQESRRRLAGKHTSDAGVSFEFVHSDLHQWIHAGPTVELICNSALLDLLTERELDHFVQAIARSRTPVYSTLNYCGIRFSPADERDSNYITLFEKHMCRQLNRGTPLGPAVQEALDRVIKKYGNLALATASSPWIIDSAQVMAGHAAFLQHNLSFYQRGIGAMLDSQHQRLDFEHWLSDKQSLLQQGALTLAVDHLDYLITPLTDDATETRVIEQKKPPAA